MSERLVQLQKMLERSPGDSFLLYGIAMEHKKAQRFDEALTNLDEVIRIDPAACHAYHQKAQTYEMSGDVEAAKGAYREGIAAASRAGNAHAGEEMAAALEMLG